MAHPVRPDAPSFSVCSLPDWEIGHTKRLSRDFLFTKRSNCAHIQHDLQYFTFVADADDEKTQAFVSKYKELYGDTPNQFGADAYDAIYAIKAAIEEAGVTPDMSVSDIGTALTEAMTKISVDGLTGDGMTWEATGEVSKAPKAMVIKDGAYTAM